MKWGRSKKLYRKNTPLCPLLSSWLSKFKKSDRGVPDSERDECGEDEEFWKMMPFVDDEEKFPPSVCRSCLSVILEEEEEGTMMFDDMVSNVRRMREHDHNSRARARGKNRSISPQEKCQLQLKTPSSAKESKSLRRTRRRSCHIKVRSPRLNNAAVNVRRSKIGRRGSHRERDSSEREYERCALVKCSYDPQGDFRESMMEMIMARGIGGTATEMEELLACYLILNDDAYHDVIIKVFRQVWFELDRRGFWGDDDKEDVVGEDQQRREPYLMKKIN